MRGLFHLPFLKIGAVTAALACAGGGLVIDHATSASGASATPAVAPASLDHYLCTGTFHRGGCDPATVALPNGSSFGVNNPGEHLSCNPERRRGTTLPAIVETNELSPGGSTPVPLAPGHFRATCSILPAVQLPSVRSHVTPVPVETFDCSSVHYPSRNSVRFAPPFPVTVDGRSARVLDPWLVCTPSGVQPTAAGPTDLVCFEARVIPNRRRFFESGFGLCVPSTNAGTPPVSSSTTSTTTGATSTTAGTTTTTKPPTSTTTLASTTTTTKPSTSTTIAATTTTTAPPPSSTTTTAPPSTTTTTRPTTGTQPCAGVLIGGVCIINA